MVTQRWNSFQAVKMLEWNILGSQLVNTKAFLLL